MNVKKILSSAAFLSVALIVPLNVSASSEAGVSNFSPEIREKLKGEIDALNVSSEETNLINRELRSLSMDLKLRRMVAGEITAAEANELTDHNPMSLQITPQVKLNDDLQIDDGVFLSTSGGEHNNTTSVMQQLRTPAFTLEAKEFASVTTSVSTGLSHTSSVNVTLPGVGGGHSTTLSVNFTNEQTTGTERTVTWEAPSQIVDVPAGEHYGARWILKMGTASGTMDFEYNTRAVVPIRQTGGFRTGIHLDNALSLHDRLVRENPSLNTPFNRNLWGQRGSNHSVNYPVGGAKYEVSESTYLHLNTYNVRTGEIVESRKFSKAAIAAVTEWN